METYTDNNTLPTHIKIEDDMQQPLQDIQKGPVTCVQCGCCGLDDDAALEDHIASVHMLYFPYRCKPCADAHEDCWLATRMALKAHTLRMHPNCKPQSMYIPDQKKDNELIEMMNRCKNAQGTDAEDEVIDYKLFISDVSTSEENNDNQEEEDEEQGLVLNEDDSQKRVSPLYVSSDNTVTDAISMVVPPTVFSGISRQCRLCERVIDSGTSLVQHVLYHHFPHKTILCPYCNDYSSRANVTDVRGHVARAHPNMPVKVVDRRHEFAQEVETLRRRCFPLSKEGKFSWTVNATVQNNTVSRESTPASDGSGSATDSSKTMLCSLCGETASVTGISKHVLRRHFNKKRIFCPYCSFGVREVESVVITHIQQTHPNETLRVIDKRSHFEKELVELSSSCFPHSFEEDTKQNGDDETEVTSASAIVKTEDVVLDEGHGGKHLHCKLCGRLARSSHTRHVMWHHLNTNVLKCPVCDFGRRDGITNVRAHIEKCHPGCTEEVIDLREQFRPEIERLKAQCFGFGSPGEANNNNGGSGTTEPGCESTVVAGIHQVGPCKLCGRVVNRDHALSHVRNCHFSRKLYSCPHCSFQTSVSISRVRLHIRQRHAGEVLVQPIDHSADFRNQLIKLRKYCFPDVGSRSADTQQQGDAGEEETFDGTATEHRMPPRSSRPHGSGGTGSGAYVCAICGRRADGPQRHVMTHHMGGRPLIRCPYPNCDFSSRHSMCRALMHLKSVHKDPTSKPIDDRSKYREQILRMARKCFPAAPLLRLCADISRDTAEQALAEVEDINDDNDGFLDESTYSSETAGSADGEDEQIEAMGADADAPLPVFNDECAPNNNDHCQPTTLITDETHGSASIQCQLCSEWCPCDRQRRHVTVRHLRHKVLQCGYCNYGEAAGNVTIVRRHLRSRHQGKPLKMIDRRNALAAEIQRIKYACFPANTPTAD